MPRICSLVSSAGVGKFAANGIGLGATVVTLAVLLALPLWIARARPFDNPESTAPQAAIPQPATALPGAPLRSRRRPGPGRPPEAGPKWVISMPDSIAGFPRVEPDSENVRQFDSAMRTVFQVPGVTGQTMRGSARKHSTRRRTIRR